MIRNNAYYELFASYTVPNPDQVGYWIDLGANSKGKIVKVYNENLRQWVKVLDASSEDAVSPFIGSNGNWWVDNRDTGIPAAGKNPYIGENGNWYVYDPLSKKFVDTGIIAKGRSAYEIAVEHGFQGTEDEWLESLKQPALDAAQVALEAAERANEEVEKLQGVYQQVTDALDLVAEATENANTAAQSANDAADRSNLIASNPPKIVNETWYMFDEETNEYVSTGIKAIGDAFTIIKTYTSVEEMQADYSNPEVGIGQFVMIDTGDVDNPEDSQLYLKGETEWKFISDLSGAQGIQGLSAYQVAVQEGFVGSEEEWVESLSKDSKEAAQLALQAKEQVEQTEQAVKDAEALRVTAESERVAAENTREENEASRIAKEAERVSAEQARVDAENSRVEAENTRAANEAARVEAENARVTAENQRASAESSRVEAEQARVTAESGRVTAEENRESAEETRKQNEEARVSAESSRVTAEQQRVTQEEQRQKNIQTAIRNTETAVENTNVAIANAEAATENANTQADRAKEFSDNPPKIQDNFWYIWDEATDTYVNTNVQAKGEKGDQGIPGESYTLPIASSTTLGGIKVGAGLQINAETGVLNATGGGTADAVDWDNITSKPDFSAVATSGDYNDLINTPNIPDVSNLATKDEVALKANSSDVYTKSETYTKTETDNAIKQASATVFKYKGTVDSFDFLPTLNVSVGDVYTLADTNEEYVATTASPDPVWEYLGVKVDLSDYSTTAENDAKYQPKGDYITEIPSEYVTEDELTAKDYATNTALTEGLAQKLNTDDLTWDIIDGKPTTLAGYDIADNDVLTTLKRVDGENSELDADMLDGKHRSNLYNSVSDWQNSTIGLKTVIDLTDTKYDIDTYYPCVGSIYEASSHAQKLITVTSFQNKADWATSANKSYACGMVIHFSGQWYGWKPKCTYCTNYSFVNVSTSPIGYTELTHAALPVIWVRGGAYITILCDSPYVWEIVTEKTQYSDEYVEPQVGGTVPFIFSETSSSTLKSILTTIYANLQAITINGESVVTPSAIEDSLSYWYENNENKSSATCNTGGNRNVIESLKSKFKRCTSYPQADGSAIISYLNNTNSNEYPDGSSAVNGYVQNIDVMVHFPKYYHKTVEVSSGVWRTYISEVQIDNDYIEEPECLVGVYEAYKNSTVDWLSSISGNISTASQNISTFFAQAQAKGADWGLINYRAHATIARMFCAYYGTTNISTLNEDIPCSGGTKRYDYGKTGGTMSLGNADGRIETREDTGYYSTSFLGLEDCYYSKWEFVQGLNIIGENYITYDGGCFPGKDVAALEEAGATNIRVIGAKPYSSEAEGTYYNGWIRRVAQGRYGDVMPTEIGGSETTYYTDYTWQYKQAATGERIFLRSGNSGDGSRCGVFVASCSAGSSSSSAYGGSRLAFYGKINVVDSDTFKNIAGI